MSRLIADVGGTNVRFAVVAGSKLLTEPESFHCADYPSIIEAAQDYLSKNGQGASFDEAAFAVAAAVTGDWIDITNNHWAFSQAEVARRLNVKRVKFLNDFTALALGLPHLPEESALPLNDAKGVKNAPIAVIGPGTGLGVSGLLPDGKGRWVPIAGEGGHATLSARTEREFAVVNQAQKQFGHCSAERLISGPGLVTLAEILDGLDGRPPIRRTPADIAEKAQNGDCPVCSEALDLLLAFLGTTASNLALTLGAFGGLYLAGGILPRLGAERLKASPLMTRFTDKGRYRDYLASIPVNLVVHPLPAFLGLGNLPIEAAP
ncbi:Glucokinase [Rhodospirillaceae bacterium LM-1]|nr:Glucokinase [Rhodospirillaceae bacterium LM-1]